MLKSIIVKRYKAFGKGKLKLGAISEVQKAVEGEEAATKKAPLSAYEGEKLEIKPITILLGANSVGKTSLLDLLLVLQQTSIYADGAPSRPSPLKLNGKIVSLGEARSLFHLTRTDEMFSIAFELDNSKRFGAYRDDFRKVLQDTLTLTGNIFRVTGKEDILEDFNVMDLSLADMVERTARSSAMLQSDTRTSRLLQNAALAPRRKRPLYSRKDLEVSAQLIEALEEIDLQNTPTTLELCFAFDEKHPSLFIKKCSILVGEKTVISFGYGAKQSETDDKSLVDLDSGLVRSSELPNYAKSLQKMLQPDRPIFRFASRGEQERTDIYFVELCWRIVRSTIADLERAFSASAIGHIDADRGAPKRYYFVDPSNEDAGQKAEFISVLQDEEGVRDAVGAWMKNFSLKIEVKVLADMLHRVLVEQGGLALGLDITDVGFGVSQILPIIVKGFSAPADSLTLVEQPEAHLHPKMQADLADLFLVMAGLANASPDGKGIVEAPLTAAKRRFVIETHSEYLLKRLRLRVAEGKVRADDVAIYFLSKSKNGSTVLDKKEMSSDGDFQWPEEFYATDLQDNIDFLMVKSARFRGRTGEGARAVERS